MPDAQIQIGKITLSSAQSSVIFTNLPQIAGDLRLVVTGSMPAATTTPAIRMNADAGANYYATNLYGSGSTASAASNASQTQGATGWFWSAPTAGDQFSFACDIYDYTASDKHKSYFSRATEGNLDVSVTTGRWASSAPITSLTILGWNGGGSYSAGSTFTLYRILS